MLKTRTALIIHFYFNELHKCLFHSKIIMIVILFEYLDDCPYPDIPSNGAHCEDATPFMCQNERFRKKCCQSCNKGNRH